MLSTFAFRRASLITSLCALSWAPCAYSLSEYDVSNCSPEESHKVKNVAIIGAGAAGASTAYYLKNYGPPCCPVNITVFERADYVGGRSTTVDLFDDPNQPVELGASIFVEINRNLVSAAKDLGLSVESAGRSTQKASKANKDSPDFLGIWDGLEFRYRQAEPSLSYWNLSKLLWKYGLSAVRSQSLAKQTTGSFLKLYEPPYFPFRSLTDAAQDLLLIDALSIPGSEYLERNSVFAPFSTDIIQASTRVNYAQNLDQIHGLETMVCMSIEGAKSVSGGNWQIFDGMIKASKATLRLNTAVTAVSKNEDGSYAVTGAPSEEEADYHAEQSKNFKTTTTQDFDSVVIAAPLQFSNIKLTPEPSNRPLKIDYVSLHVTLFTSPHELSGPYFSLPVTSAAPATVLTTLPLTSAAGNRSTAQTLPFFSISTLRQVFNPHYSPPRLEYAYKIFSAAPLSSDFIRSILGLDIPAASEERIGSIDQHEVSWSHEKVWHSYPYLPPKVEFDGPVLDDNLWYTAGIESFISTMETSSLMGKNVARLITDEWSEETIGGWGTGEMKQERLQEMEL